MIVLSVIILLVILIFANLAISLFNHIYPPCESTLDYFKSDRLLPNGITTGLETVHNGKSNKNNKKPLEYYVPDVIGLDEDREKEKDRDRDREKDRERDRDREKDRDRDRGDREKDRDRDRDREKDRDRDRERERDRDRDRDNKRRRSSSR